MFKIKIKKPKPWKNSSEIKALPHPHINAPKGFKHAWYSKTAAKDHGSSFYKSVDMGKAIEVTDVSTSPEKPCYNDIIYVGFVTKWVSGGQTGIWKTEKYENRDRGFQSYFHYQ